MDRRVNTYRPRGRSSYREGRFEERPPTRGPSHERSPFQQDLPQRYRQFREGDGNEWPVDSHERRDVVTRRFTERPHSHSPSFEIDPYRHNSPGRDSPVFSKRRKFKEVPDRSPVNQRHFSPDTFAMNPVSVDDSVGRSAGGNRLSPNTLMRLQQGQGSLFSSELDKLKGYESPEYSDHGDEDNYGDSFNARNDVFYEKQKFETLSKNDDLQNLQPQPKDRYLNPFRNTGSTPVMDPYGQIGFRNIDPHGGVTDTVAYQYKSGAETLESPVGNDTGNFDNNERVQYNPEINTIDQEYYMGDKQRETRKRPMDRSDFIDDDVKFRRTEYPESIDSRHLHPVGFQTERNRIQSDRYRGQLNPNMESLSADKFPHSNINQMNEAVNLNPDRKKELDILLSQSEMLHQRINNIITTEKNQGDFQMSGVGMRKMPYSVTLSKQSKRSVDESQYDWGYNPPWRQNELGREQELKPARQTDTLNQPVDDDYEDDDAYMPRHHNNPRFQGQHKAPRIHGQNNAPRVQGQPDFIQGFQPSAQSRIPGQHFDHSQSSVSTYEKACSQPFNPVHKNISEKEDFRDSEIASFKQQGIQRKPLEYEFPPSRQTNIQRQNNVNMQKQGQFLSRPPQAALHKPVTGENTASIARYPYETIQKQATWGDGRPLTNRHAISTAQKPFAEEYEPQMARYPQETIQKPYVRQKEPSRYPQTVMDRESVQPRYPQTTAPRPYTREKELPRYPQTSAQKFFKEKQPPKYSQRTEKQPGTQEREPFNQPPKKLQELATSENKFSNSNPNLSKSANRNTGQNLQQRTSSLGKSQTPKTSENVAEETASFEMENEEFVTWTEDNNVETDLDLEEKSKTNGPKQKDSRVPDEVEFQASGRWLGVSKIRWNIKPISDQTKVVVKKKDGATLFVASGTTCRVEKPYKNRIKFHGDTSLGTLNFDLEDCCFADEGLYTGSYENKTFHGPNLKLWTHAIEGETALVLFKMPKMPPNEKVTVYKKNGDTLLIAWGTMAQFTDKYKGKLEYFGDTEKGLIVFSIKNTVQPQSGIYMASVGNNNYEGRQLKVDLPAQKKKRKKKFATSAVKEKGMTDMINFLKQKSKNERVEPSSLSRLANYKSVPLFFDYRSIPGPAGSRCITGTICAYEDLYLARMSGKSKEEVKPKLLERALSNLLSKTYNQLVQNSFKELELPISLLSNQISKGILQLGGEIAKIPSIKKEDVKTSAVGQKKPTPPVVKQNTSSPTKPATPTTTAMKTTNLSSTSGDIKIDLLQANDEKAKEILRSMATSSDISNSDFLDSISSMKNRKGVELKYLLKLVGIREKFKMESGLGESSEKIRTTNNVYSNLKFYSYSERQQACNKSIDEFIIFHGYPKDELAANAYEILLESAKTCVMHLEWHSKQLIPASRGVLPITVCRCFVWVQGKLVGDAVTVGGKVGRQLATAQALAYLIKRQPVIQYLELEKQSSFCVTLKEAQRRAEVLKEQKGQKEDPKDNPNKWLSQVCEDIVLQYSTEPTVENLEFQPGFPKKVLLDIKKICDKHELTFKAYLKDKEYINVVGKNLNPGEILSLLQQNGGTSGKYRLVPKLECEAIAEEMLGSLTDDLYLDPNPYNK